MTRGRGILSSLIAAVAALVLTACAGLPTSGPVNPGLPPEQNASPPDIAFLPDLPLPGATPQQIVQGFIRAGSGPGPLENWERAREFLAPSIKNSWQPDASVTIDEPGDRLYAEDGEGAVTLSLVAVATVDAMGTYERAEAGPTTLAFQLEQQEDGEWRITVAPDGIVLDRDTFPNVFHSYSLQYFDPTWEFLVPDVRWYPTRRAAARITGALVNGAPSPWLAESVATAFPEAVTVSPSVPVDAGVAEVELGQAALAVTPETLDRMATQLQASLTTVPGVTAVELSVGTAPLEAEAVPVRSTRVTGPSLVLNEEGFGFLSGDELEPVPGLSEVLKTVSPVSIQMTPERDWVATRLTDGTVTRQGADQSSDLLDARPNLIDPTIDPFGVTWSVPHNQPSDVDAFLLDGTRIDIADAWPGAALISAMSISRDGTRMAAVVTSGARTLVWVAGVVREDGVPRRLGAPVPIGAVGGEGVGVAWVDDTTVGVVSHEGEGSFIVEQVVGGPATATAAPVGIASIAGASTVSTVRLRDSEGVLYVRRGTNWQQVAAGVAVLATQQGMPQ